MKQRVLQIVFNERGSFDVVDGELVAHCLTFDEMLGEVARRTLEGQQKRTYLESPDQMTARFERQLQRAQRNQE